MSTAQQRLLVRAADPAGSSVVVRCHALGLARSFYYQPKAETALSLTLMRLLDEEFTRHNFEGVRGLRDHLRLAGYLVNEKRVRPGAPDGPRARLPQTAAVCAGAGRHALSVLITRPAGHGAQ